MLKDSDFIAQLEYRTSEEGGRKTPAFSNYRPQVQFHHLNDFQTSGQQIFIDKEVVYPGESVEAEISLISYYGLIGNIDIGSTFNFLEGSRVIGTGTVTKFLNPHLENYLSYEEQVHLAHSLNTGIELAIGGRCFPFQSKLIEFDIDEGLSIAGFVKTLDYKNISKKIVLAEIENLKNYYWHWLGLSPRLQKIEAYRKTLLCVHFDYGKGSIRICEVSDDKIYWLVDIE